MNRYDIIFGKKPILHFHSVDSQPWPCCDPKHCKDKNCKADPELTDDKFETFSERLAQRASWPSFREREKKMRMRAHRYIGIGKR